jgi:glycosyltransferase involved in cell wall biosynthesis
MRIALIRREYITHLDGVNRFIALLAEGLRRLGHEVEIFSWCYRGVDGEGLEGWFKEIHGLDMSIPVHTLRKEPCEGDPWVRIALDWFFKGSAMLKEAKFDAAIVNGIMPLRFKPKVAVIHDLGPLLASNRFYSLLGKTILKVMYDKVICVSTKTRQELYTTLKLSCKVIPIPLELDAYKPRRPDERENIVVHIGTRPVKNPQVSLEAIRILREQGYDIKLVMIGSPVQLPRTDAVEYAFGVTEKEKLELLCKAKALILPSKYEGFSYVALEAMACGTPVVVSSAVPEEVVINNFNGIRVDSFNPEDYADALEKLLTDEELWLKLSRNGLEFVKRFDYIEIAKRYVSIISELL